MQTCAYCGRRLPWLHRVVGKARYCSKEHARLHLETLGESVMKALMIGAGAAETAENHGAGTGHAEASAFLPINRSEDSLFPVAPGLEAAGAGAGAPVAGHCAAVPAEPLPPTPLLEPPPLRFELEKPAAEQAAAMPKPAPPVRLAAFVAGPLAPAAAAQRLRVRPHALKPKRRVVAPAHRARPQVRWALAGEVPARVWTDPVAAQPFHPGLFPVVPPQPSPQAAAPVVVFSFLDGADPGGSAGGRSLPRRARESYSPGSPCVDAAARLFIPAEPVLRYPAMAPRSRRVPARFLAPQPWQTASIAARPGLRLLSVPPPNLWEQQAGAVQPFRLHRMPLRPFRLRPLRAPGSSRPSTPPTLGRLSLLSGLHLPRSAAMPVRPVYRWCAAPAATDGGAPGASISPAPARVPRG